jgi:parallel beta-helix repeat protein
MNSGLTTVHHSSPTGIVLVLLSGWLALSPSASWAATYYVDGSNPSARDTNPGTQAQPWKTIGKATGLLQPGDTVYIKAGVYRETIVLSRSGTSTTAYTRDGWVTTTSPITIAAYPGHEGKVIINAAEPVTNWRKCTGPQDCAGNPNWSHIYWADVAGLVAAHPDQDFAIRQVFQHGERLPRSRYPDTRWSYPTTVVDPRTTFSDSTLSKPAGYFNGAVCHIKTAQFRIDQIPIASFSDSTIVLAENAWYDISTRFGYYITSIVGEINAAGEWAYDAARKRLYLWPKGEVANNVEFSYRKDCVCTDFWVSYVVVRGLTMRYAYKFGAFVTHANNITLENNTIEYAFSYGIELRSTWGPCNDNQILRNTIKYCAQRAINVDTAAARCKIEGNYIYATGVEFYGGDFINIDGLGVYVVGPFARVYGNRIDRSGSGGLFFGSARGQEVSYNYITNSGLALADIAAIYMAGRAEGPDKDYVHHNIIEDTPGCHTMEKSRDTGAPVTVEAYAGMGTGIGLDEECNNRVIEDNTIIRSSWMGIGVHWSPGNIIQRNTLYSNKVSQLFLDGKNEEHKAILDEVVLDNILFATDTKQRTLYVSMNYDNVHFGQSDRNYFYHPYNNTHIFVSRYLTPSSGEYHDYLTLGGWQSLSGYDRNSREFSYLTRLPGVTLRSPTQSRIVYNASLDVNTVDLGPDLYCDVQGHGIRGKLTLQPFESRILLAAVAAVVSAPDDKSGAGPGAAGRSWETNGTRSFFQPLRLSFVEDGRNTVGRDSPGVPESATEPARFLQELLPPSLPAAENRRPRDGWR